MQLTIALKSYTLCGSGEGRGLIDSDVVFDRYGYPYIPGRRVKGLLRESALEVIEMLGASESLVSLLFGSGGFMPGSLTMPNLRLPDYQDLVKGARQISGDRKYNSFVNPAAITSFYTEIRQQTRIDEETGIAADASLRTIRTLVPGTEFTGTVAGATDDAARGLLFLAAANLRHMGTGRNRGLGEIRCSCGAEGKPPDTAAAITAVTSWNGAAMPSPEPSTAGAPAAGDTLSDAMVSLPFSIETRDPIVASVPLGDENTVNTADYFSGPIVAGILAARITERLSLERGREHEDPLFRSVVLGTGRETGVTVSPAFLADEERSYTPAPLSLQRKKGDDNKVAFNIAARDQEGTKPIGGLAGLEDRVCYAKGPEKTLFFHTTRGSSRTEGKSTSEDGAIFFYEALEPGQTFRGELLGPEKALKRLVDVCGPGFDCRVGRSRSAQYGGARFSFGEPASPDDEVTAGDTLTIVCRSPLLLRDTLGFHSPSAALLEDALSRFFEAPVEVKQSFARRTTVGGFVAALGCRIPRMEAFAEGSTFVCMVNGLPEIRIEEKAAELARLGLGERAFQGFGRLTVQPEALENRELIVEDAETVRQSSTDLLPSAMRNIVIHAINRRLKLEVEKEALEKAGSFKNRLNNHQIGRLEGFVTTAKNCEELREKLDALRKTARNALEKCVDKSNEPIWDALWDFVKPVESLRKDMEKCDAKTLMAASGITAGDTVTIEELARRYWITLLRRMRKLNKENNGGSHGN